MKKNKNIALIGQPNSGKSTLFSVLSDIKSPISGSTFELNANKINHHGQTFNIIDLPGTYSLNPSQETEIITYKYLTEESVDLIINVVDATLLPRSLELTVELIELGLPMIVALNMTDEAEEHGIKIDHNKLSELLKIPVIPTQALFGKGVKELLDHAAKAIKNKNCVAAKFDYTHHLELHLKELSEIIENKLGNYHGNSRFYAIKAIENPQILPEPILSEVVDLRNSIEEEIIRSHHKDAFETISYERHHLSMKLAEDITVFSKKGAKPFIERLDKYLLAPVLGYVLLIIFFLLYFSSVFYIGEFLAGLIEQPLADLAQMFAFVKNENEFLWFSINGAYQGVLGMAGIVLPYFLPLVFLTSIIEDSGYLSRVAFLIDGVMHKIGLHGKSVVAFILGFGCTVPALYATRMIENPRDRKVTAILLPFIPCSARITVIFALAAAFTGPLWAFVIFAFIILVIAVSGKLLSKILSEPMGLILEIPRLKKPRLVATFKSTWLKTKDLLREAMIFLVGGGVVLGWVEYFGASKYLNKMFAPILHYVLGLPEELGSTLFFGFFRKELVLVMINQAMGVQHISDLPLTVDQIIVFVIFVALYFPCFTTFIVLWKEFRAKVAILSGVVSMLIAIFCAFLFKIILAI